MALIGINPTRGKDKESTLSKVLSGLSVASDLLGTTLDVSRFVREGKIQERAADVAEAKAATDLQEEFTVSPGTPETIPGMGIPISGTRIEPSEAGAIPVTPAQQKILGVGAASRLIPRSVDSGIAGFTKKEVVKNQLEDKQIVPQGTEGATLENIGGIELWTKPKVNKADTNKIFDQENTLRDDFLKQAGAFKAQNDAIGRIISVSQDPSAAGDLALIFNYMKLLDPGSVVRESEYRTAEQARASFSRLEGQGIPVPAFAKIALQKLETGRFLLPEQRADFVDRASRLYDGARLNHDNLEKSFVGIAKRGALNPDNVVIPIVLPSKQQAAMQKMKTEALKVLKTREGPTEEDEDLFR